MKICIFDPKTSWTNMRRHETSPDISEKFAKNFLRCWRSKTANPHRDTWSLQDVEIRWVNHPWVVFSGKHCKKPERFAMNCHLGVDKSTSLPTKWGPLLDSKVDHLHMFHGWNTYNFYPETHGLNLNNSTCTIHGANVYKRGGSNTP